MTPIHEQAQRHGIEALKYMTDKGIPLIGVYPSGAMIAPQQPENFTLDAAEIAALINGEGNKNGHAKGQLIKRFYFIPERAGFLCLDIDRKEEEIDGLEEFYKLFPSAILPRTLQNIETFFPCYVSTPSGGYHLYFRYSGTVIHPANLCLGVEIKYGRPGLTAPGSSKENGEYILHGNLDDAPPLYGIIIDCIKENLKQTRKNQYSTNHLTTHKNIKSSCAKITLDTLANEAVSIYRGHHDRQVSFAGKACRCNFTLAESLNYVRENPYIFGVGKDTENTIRSLYKCNGRL
jgi:hypothetical protein